MQLLFETIIDHIANFTATSQTFEIVKVRRISSLINNNLIERISTVEPRLSVLLDHPDFFFGPNFFMVIN